MGKGAAKQERHISLKNYLLAFSIPVFLVGLSLRIRSELGIPINIRRRGISSPAENIFSRSGVLARLSIKSRMSRTATLL